MGVGGAVHGADRRCWSPATGSCSAPSCTSRATLASNTLRIEEARRVTLLIGDYSRLRFQSSRARPTSTSRGLGRGSSSTTCCTGRRPAGTPRFWPSTGSTAPGWRWAAAASTARPGRSAAQRPRWAVFAAAAVLHPVILGSDWMSFLYVQTYSDLRDRGGVGGGRPRRRDAWILALAGWFLIHGHAAYLFFVPVFIAAVLVAVLWPVRRTLRASIGGYSRAVGGSGCRSRRSARRLPAADRDQPRPALAGRLRQVRQLRILVGGTAGTRSARWSTTISGSGGRPRTRPRPPSSPACRWLLYAVAIGLLAVSTPPGLRRFGATRCWP